LLAPRLAKRMDCVQLAGAFGFAGAFRSKPERRV